jgi:hypothetical protein
VTESFKPSYLPAGNSFGIDRTCTSAQMYMNNGLDGKVDKKPEQKLISSDIPVSPKLITVLMKISRVFFEKKNPRNFRNVRL